MPRQEKSADDPNGNAQATKELAAIMANGGVAQALREQGKTPTIVTKPKPEEALYTGLFPTDDNQQEFFDAQKNLAIFEKEKTDREAALAAQERADYVYFVRCRNYSEHPQGQPSHGLYFTDKPNESEVNDGDWYTGYKKKTDIWRQAVYCQVCLRAGTERVLPVEMIDWRKGKWRPDPRWVFKVPRDLERARIEGESRAWPIRGETNNQHALNARARWDEHQAKKAAAQPVEVSRG